MRYDSRPVPLTVIVINGPINSGKSTVGATVGAALAAHLPDAVFVDGDDRDGDDTLPLTEQWTFALARIRRRIDAATCRYRVVAWPLSEADFASLRDACARRAARLVVSSSRHSRRRSTSRVRSAASAC